jgi:hypothetical protein
MATKRGVEFFSISFYISNTQCVQGVASLRLKQQEREADHSPLSSAKVKNDGAIPPLSHTLS